eukprot:9568269-Karenia_brevis.AAC.1
MLQQILKRIRCTPGPKRPQLTYNCPRPVAKAGIPTSDPLALSTRATLPPSTLGPTSPQRNLGSTLVKI